MQRNVDALLAFDKSKALVVARLRTLLALEESCARAAGLDWLRDSNACRPAVVAIIHQCGSQVNQASSSRDVFPRNALQLVRTWSY